MHGSEKCPWIADLLCQVFSRPRASGTFTFLLREGEQGRTSIVEGSWFCQQCPLLLTNCQLRKWRPEEITVDVLPLSRELRACNSMVIKGPPMYRLSTSPRACNQPQVPAEPVSSEGCDDGHRHYSFCMLLLLQPPAGDVCCGYSNAQPSYFSRESIFIQV